jgi:hypothetical protein
MVLVYHTKDDKVVGFNGDPANQNGKLTLFYPTIGDTYSIVVGAEDGLTTGSYTLTANVGWQFVSKPDISIGNLTLAKSGMMDDKTPVYFPVTLSHPWNKDVSVDYSAVHSCPGIKLNSGQLTIKSGPGQPLQGGIPVQIIGYPPGKGDLLFEEQISNPVNGTIVKALGHGTIQDDGRDSWPGEGYKFDPPGTNGNPKPHSGGYASAPQAYDAVQGATLLPANVALSTATLSTQTLSLSSVPGFHARHGKTGRFSILDEIDQVFSGDVTDDGTEALARAVARAWIEGKRL